MTDISPAAITEPSADTYGLNEFKISKKLRDQLEELGNFSCDGIWYGFPATHTSGQLDGYRWLFSADKSGDRCLFVIFARGGAQEVTFENIKTLAHEESWDDFQKLSPTIAGGLLSHEEVLVNILRSARKFRAKRPFENESI